MLCLQCIIFLKVAGYLLEREKTRAVLSTPSIYKAVLVTPKVLSPTSPRAGGGLRLELGLHGTSSETENTSTVYIKELGGGTSDGNPLVTSILAQPGRDSIRNIHKLTSLWRAGPVVSILCTLNMLAHVNHTTTLLRKGLSSFPFYW